MSENIQTKDEPDPKRSNVVIDTAFIIVIGASVGIIIGNLLKNFSFSFECSYNKEYEEEEEEGLLPPPYKS